MVGCGGGGADLELEDPALGARHAKVWLEDGVVWYEDLGSPSGSLFQGRRLEGRVSLEPGDSVKLGGTRLSLSSSKQLEDGMELKMHGSVDPEALTQVLGASGRVARYVSALSEFVQELLNSKGFSSLPKTMQRLREVIPGGQISLVAWPLGPSGRAYHLVPPSEKARPVSRSLAQSAVDRREALLFSETMYDVGGDVEKSTKVKGIRSAVYVPLMDDKDRVIAILCIDSPSPSFALDPDLFQFIRAVGGLLSSSLAADELREEARRSELEAAELKSHREALANFLRIASHDLRSPLAVVRGFSALIEDEEDVEAIKSLNARVRNASSRADALIRAYLEVGALTSDRELKLNLEILDLHRMVAEEMQFVEDAHGEKGPSHTFSNRVPEGLEVEADPVKLRQILDNLIINAARYTLEEGEVVVEASPVDDGIEVRVVDHGVGISESDQKKLFQQFARAGDTRQVPGTGLGLWLTAALVRAHGGEIRVESRLGEGTTFSFTLRSPSGERGEG